MSERMDTCALCDGLGYARISANANILACVAAIRDHLGGKPELVREVVAELRRMVEAFEGAHVGDAPRIAGRAILSRIENGNG